MHIHIHPVAKGEILPLACGSLSPLISHNLKAPALPRLSVGARLCHEGEEIFSVVGRILMPTNQNIHAPYLPLLRAEKNFESPMEYDLDIQRKDFALAWITLSDKGSLGQRQDKSGPLIEDILKNTLSLCHKQGFLLPDDATALRALLLELALGQGYDIICTTGGTGLGPRDVTPQAMLSCIDQRLYGFEQMMMTASLQKTPHAALSRAVVGTVGTCLCINLPGSVKAVRENLEAILPALPHALQKIQGDSTDCGPA